MRRWLWIGGAAAAVVVVVVIGVVAWPRHHKRAVATHLALPDPGAPQSPGARQLLALLRTGQDTTWHGTYKVTGVPDATLTLEVWQSPPQLREDVVRTAGGHTVHSSTFVLRDGTTQLCVRQDADKWSCSKVGTDPNDIVSSAAAGLAGQSVTVTDDTVGGRKVTCFQATSGPRLCATASGIPVLVSDTKVSYTLDTLSSSVPGSAFTLPRA